MPFDRFGYLACPESGATRDLRDPRASSPDPMLVDVLVLANAVACRIPLALFGRSTITSLVPSGCGASITGSWRRCSGPTSATAHDLSGSSHYYDQTRE